MRSALAFLFLVLSFSQQSFAKDNVIKFKDDELARETVLPVFEKAPMVKNRRVSSSGRFELGGGVGFSLDEPFYNPQNFNATVGYYFSENHGFVFSPVFLSTSLSDKGTALKKGEGLSGDKFDPSLAPSLTSIYFLDYQLNAFYGKISLTKQSVVNLSLFFLMGLNIPVYEDSNQYGFDFGFGQKYYFSQSTGLRFDLRFLVYKGLSLPSDADELNPDTNPTPRSSDQFDKTWIFQSMLNLQFVFMI